MRKSPSGFPKGEENRGGKFLHAPWHYYMAAEVSYNK